MRLTIDTSKKDKFVLFLGDKVLEHESLNNSSQALLPGLRDLLIKNHVDLKDISEIVVFTKGESYTGLRVGVSIAQALSFLLDVPINGEYISKIGYINVEY